MKLNPEEIKNNNFYSFHRYKTMKEMIYDYELDDDKENRIKDRECKSCYYLRKPISLQAFTDYKCQNCDSNNTWHNGNTPKYCNNCCDEHKVCKRCGANIEDGGDA